MNGTSVPVSIGKMLLVSPSSLTMYQLAKSAHRFDMSVEVCTKPRTALALVNRQKFDAVAVDLSLGPSASAILREIRQSASNRTAVAFAISGNKDESAAAVRAGSSFVLERPLTFTSIKRTLQAAHGLILRERRRVFRCPIAIPVSLQQEGVSVVEGETVNISEGGMGLRIPSLLQRGVEGRVQFTLPGGHRPITAETKVCWCNEQHRAGLFFASISRRDTFELQGWVASKFEEQVVSRPSDETGACAAPPQCLGGRSVIDSAWSDLT